MTWRPRNLNEALLPYSTIYAIIGHGIFQYPIGRPRVFFSLVYSIIMAILFFGRFGYVMVVLLKLSWNNTEEKMFLIMILTQTAGLTLAHALSWYYRKTFVLLMKRMMNVDETLRKLGAKLNYDGIMYMSILMIIYWIIMLAGLNTIDVIWFLDDKSSIFMAYVIITTANHPVNTNALVALNFAQSARIVGTRYYELNELIANSSESYLQQKKHDRDWNILRNNDGTMNSTFNVSKRRNFKINDNLKSFIQTVKHVHLELFDISRCIDNIYGKQIALEMACFFITFTGLIYNLFNVVIDPHAERRNLRIILNCAWAVAIFLNLMIINRSCENVSAEAERTGDLIHGINVNQLDHELSDEIRQFSLQLLKNPLRFTPGGFFTLGYPLVQGFLVSVVTHVVILIDMGYEYD